MKDRQVSVVSVDVETAVKAVTIAPATSSCQKKRLPVAFLLLSILSVSGAAVFLHFLRSNGGPGGPVAPVMVDVNYYAQAVAGGSSETAVIGVENPVRSFHTHHWFHMAEFYTSQHERFSDMAHYTSAVVLAPSRDFMNQLNAMSFFLLCLAFHRTNLTSIHIFYAGTPWSQETRNISISDTSQSLMASLLQGRNEEYTWVFDLRQKLSTRFHRASLVSTSQSEIPAIDVDPQRSMRPFLHFDGQPRESGKWIAEDADADSMRSRIASMCATTPLATPPAGSRGAGSGRAVAESAGKAGDAEQAVLQMVVYVRDINRKFTDLRGLLSKLCAGSRCVSIMDVRYDSREMHSVNDAPYRDILSSSRRTYATRNRTSTRYSACGGGSDGEREMPPRAQTQRAEPYSRRAQAEVGGGVSATDPPSSRWSIAVMHHSEDMQPCVFHKYLSGASLFVSTHGFQSMAMLFMPRGSVLFEAFPYKYFKPTYMNLARTYGIHHRWVQNTSPALLSLQQLSLRAVTQSECMESILCRTRARGADVSMPAEHVDVLLDAIDDIELGCLPSTIKGA